MATEPDEQSCRKQKRETAQEWEATVLIMVRKPAEQGRAEEKPDAVDTEKDGYPCLHFGRGNRGTIVEREREDGNHETAYNALILRFVLRTWGMNLKSVPVKKDILNRVRQRCFRGRVLGGGQTVKTAIMTVLTMNVLLDLSAKSTGGGLTLCLSTIETGLL